MSGDPIAGGPADLGGSQAGGGAVGHCYIPDGVVAASGNVRLGAMGRAVRPTAWVRLLTCIIVYLLGGIGAALSTSTSATETIALAVLTEGLAAHAA